MPKIKKNKIEQCTKIFIYRDLKDAQKTLSKGNQDINKNIFIPGLSVRITIILSTL